MIKHPDPEIQFLVELLEGQRDQAVAQAAAYFRMTQALQAEVEQLKTAMAKHKDRDCGSKDGD